MSKFFINEDDRARAPGAMCEDRWFLQHQRSLLEMVNTKFGRDLIGLPQDYPFIVKIRKNCVHMFLGIEGDRAHFAADFRVGAQFANTIRMRWGQYQSFARYFITKGAYVNPYISPLTKLNLSMVADTGTFYPDANPETTTVDGRVMRDLVNETFATIRAGAGTTVEDSGVDERACVIEATASANQYLQMARALYLFDLSSIGSGKTFSAGVFSYAVTSKRDMLVCSGFTLCAGVTASNTALATADYASNVGATAWSAVKAYADVATSGYTDWTMNATAVGALTAGIVKCGLQVEDDRSNSNLLTWTSAEVSRLNGEYADATNKPKLFVTYTAAVDQAIVMMNQAVRRSYSY